jgi:formamidopyrimidine-DNA glycosylase
MTWYRDQITPAQKSAMLRLERSERGHEQINLVVADALARRGLVEFVYPRGHVRLTEFGKRWNDFRS